MTRLRIDIRDARLPGERHRLNISADTASEVERDQRAHAVRKLLDLGERGLAIVERLRKQELAIAEVERAVSRMDLAALEAIPAPEPKDPTRVPVRLGPIIDRFLLRLEGTDKSGKTVESYGLICGKIEAAFGRGADVGRIDSKECEAWLYGPKEHTKGKEAWSPRTQKVAHSVAAQIWDIAIIADEEQSERLGTERSIARNPFRSGGTRKGITPPRVKYTRVEFLTRKDAARLLRKLRGHPYAAWCATAIYAGLRAGEVANLRRGIDVDFAKKRLRIQPREGQWAWRPKSDRSTRDVPLHPALERFLRQHIRLGFAGDTYMFRPAGHDRPLHIRTRVTWTKDAFEEAGIRYGRQKDALTYHSLRHTFASWLTQKNVHPLKIAKLMGDDVAMVMSTYAHLIREDLEEAIRSI